MPWNTRRQILTQRDENGRRVVYSQQSTGAVPSYNHPSAPNPTVPGAGNPYHQSNIGQPAFDWGIDSFQFSPNFDLPNQQPPANGTSSSSQSQSISFPSSSSGIQQQPDREVDSSTSSALNLSQFPDANTNPLLGQQSLAYNAPLTPAQAWNLDPYASQNHPTIYPFGSGSNDNHGYPSLDAASTGSQYGHQQLQFQQRAQQQPQLLHQPHTHSQIQSPPRARRHRRIEPVTLDHDDSVTRNHNEPPDLDEDHQLLEARNRSIGGPQIRISRVAEQAFTEWFNERRRLPTRRERRSWGRLYRVPSHIVNAWFRHHVINLREAAHEMGHDGQDDILDNLEINLNGITALPLWQSQEERIWRFVEDKKFLGCGPNPKAKNGELKCIHGCGAGFPLGNKAGWMRHLEISEPQKIFECRSCRQMFHRDSHVNTHFRNNHAEEIPAADLEQAITDSRLHYEPSFRRKCGFCPLVYTDWRRLHTHIYDHFTGKLPGGKCTMKDWKKPDKIDEDDMSSDSEDDLDNDVKMEDVYRSWNGGDDDDNGAAGGGSHLNSNFGGFAGGNSAQRNGHSNPYNNGPVNGGFNGNYRSAKSTETTSSESTQEKVLTPQETREPSVVSSPPLLPVAEENEPVLKEEETIADELFAVGSRFDYDPLSDEGINKDHGSPDTVSPASTFTPIIHPTCHRPTGEQEKPPKYTKSPTASEPSTKHSKLPLIDGRLAAISSSRTLLLLARHLRPVSRDDSTTESGWSDKQHVVKWPQEFGDAAFFASFKELHYRRNEYWMRWYGGICLIQHVSA